MATDPLRGLLQHQPAIILDGAMGTEIERRGIDLTGSRLWSAQLLIDNPDVIRDIHLDYLRAGADVITTASYQASLQGFADAGLSPSQAAEKIRLSVQLAAEARAAFLASPDGQASGRQRPLVGFSCGAYGAVLCDGSEFTGTYADTMAVQELMDWHLERLQPIIGNQDVDLICFETVPCLLEVKAICRLLSTHPRLRGVCAWVSCSCRDGKTLWHGESFANEVIPELWRCNQVIGIGINCTAPQHIPQLLTDARNALLYWQEEDDCARATCEAAAGSSDTDPNLPDWEGWSIVEHVRRRPPPVLITYPNSGEDWDGAGRCWRCGKHAVAEPAQYAAAARGWVAAGASAVGGCCRTGPAHIAAVREALLRGS